MANNANNSINGLAPGQANVLLSEENKERQRTLSSDNAEFGRSRTGTFKHVFCDYDISQF